MEINEHLTGIGMKEAVRRALYAIRNQRQAFESQVKKGYTGLMNDVLTSADTEAQRIYLRLLQECFPEWGIIAEEDNLTLPCKDGSDTFFTVDPLDGTKAFVRRQSHGVGTMLSLSCKAEFLAAYVGDVNTQEIFGFRPGSTKVHRITEFNIAEQLEIQPESFPNQYILLREALHTHSPMSQELITTRFKSHLIDGGSIGLWIARLWKGEVGAVVLRSGVIETPWDSNPVNAITLRLGFVYLKPSEDSTHWVYCTPTPITEKYERTHDVLIVHKSALPWLGM